jgi:hypothetical protein
MTRRRAGGERVEQKVAEDQIAVAFRDIGEGVLADIGEVALPVCNKDRGRWDFCRANRTRKRIPLNTKSNYINKCVIGR